MARNGHVRRRVIAATCAVLAGTGVGVGVAETRAAGAPPYRTAVAADHSMSRTLQVTGTLQPVNEATVAFQTSGSVATVAVTAGQAVSAGQTLATMDPTTLQADVNAASAALNAAGAKLSADESGQVTTATGAPAPSPSPSASPATNPVSTASISGETGGGSSGPTTDQTQADRSVVAAQHAADTDLQTAQTEMRSVASICATDGPSSSAPASGTVPERTTTTPPSPPPDPGTAPTSHERRPGEGATGTDQPGTSPSSSGGGTSVPGPSPGSSAGPRDPGSAGSGSDSACADALARVAAAEQRVAADQASVMAAEDSLARLLAQATANPSRPSPLPAGSGPVSTGTSRSILSGASATDTPEELAADQAAIDSDQASLVETEQDLHAATLTSPIDGTVASVNLTPGQTVGASSTTATVTVVNTGSYQATATLTTAQIAGIDAGDAATMTVDGTAGVLDGRVSRVGPVQISGSSYAFPVVVAVVSPTGRMPAGSTARITVDLAAAESVLGVPTSAVHTSAPGASFVLLDRGGQETRQRVAIGVVGPVYTQVLSGLDPGQIVVIADPSQAVPASSTTNLRGLAGLVGGAGGFRVRPGGGGGFGPGTKGS